jgi:hypothetical protein
MCGALSDERLGLLFSVVAGHCQRSLSRSESSRTRKHYLPDFIYIYIRERERERRGAGSERHYIGGGG